MNFKFSQDQEMMRDSAKRLLADLSTYVTTAMQLAVADLDMATDDYWMFYFSLTFFHYLHVILGMVFIGMVWVRLRSVASCGDEQAYWVETVASYWHMVDLVWLVLFALVYIAH